MFGVGLCFYFFSSSENMLKISLYLGGRYPLQKVANMLSELIRRIKRIFDPPLFIIQIKGEKAETIAGKVPKKFLDELIGLCKDNCIGYTRIYAINAKEGVRLQFTESIPENIRQRIRNLYGIYK